MIECIDLFGQRFGGIDFRETGHLRRFQHGRFLPFVLLSRHIYLKEIALWNS